jgi:hypothetical protein
MPVNNPSAPLKDNSKEFDNLKNFLKNKVPKVKNQRYFVYILSLHNSPLGVEGFLF